jgi:putative PIN family toxin of toxin-antitoxin system
MKVFLDTNVLVSGFATRGLCADVVREVLTSHDSVISTQLLAELARVLRNKIGAPSSFVAEIVEMLKQDACVSKPTPLPDVLLRDRSDLPILSSALNGKADLLVTGDKELLALGKVKNLEIVSPRGFWEKLKAQPAHAPGKR